MWSLIALLSALTTQLVDCNHENNDIGSEENYVYTPSWWGYRCEPNVGCQQVQRSLQSWKNASTQETLHESLDLCRLVCGRFGSLWPRPVAAVLGSETVLIHPKYLRSDLNSMHLAVQPLAESMFEVFKKNILAECGGHVSDVVTNHVVVYINVSSPSLVINWKTNEEYLLDITEKEGEVSVHIIAPTIFGARHALETLSHLVASNKAEFSTKKECSLYMLSRARITDKPVYLHRGLVLDTSRNFMPVDAIKRTMDGMAASKMNVFHWHVTDTHSFPLQSSRVPQFTKYGAYSESEIYSIEEVQELIRYAQVRGIRVVIEIDAPAHAGNGWQWGPDYGLGDLALCVNANPWRQYCIQPPCGTLNPANPAVFQILKKLYQDIVDFLPSSPLLHMGGDELFINCWNSSAEIQFYMNAKGMEPTMEGFMDLWGEFQAEALKTWDQATNSPQPVMIWTSELTKPIRIGKYLDKDRYIIQVWEPLGSPDLEQLLKLGYQVVASPKDVWYLDHGFWAQTKYSNWRRMYNHMLSNRSNVLGGEVAMWTEYVNSHSLDTRIWPRAAAVAERLWSDPNSINQETEARLQRLRDILVARGLSPDAISPGWCATHASKCN